MVPVGLLLVLGMLVVAGYGTWMVIRTRSEAGRRLRTLVGKAVAIGGDRTGIGRQPYGATTGRTEGVVEAVTEVDVTLRHSPGDSERIPLYAIHWIRVIDDPDEPIWQRYR